MKLFINTAEITTSIQNNINRAVVKDVTNRESYIK